MPDIKLSSGVSFKAESEISILDAAAKAHVLLPYSCKTGRCSTCKCKLTSGSTTLLQPESGLTDEERAVGWILSCVRSAASDLLLEVEDLGGIILPLPKTLPCRISQLERMAPDVIQALLRLPPNTDFNFLPGQYIEVIGTNGVRRSYSLANASFASKTLELHIRAVTDGVMSQYWFTQAKINDLLRLNGPLGTFFLRDTAGIDLIFLATGTGLAPVKAMLQSLGDLADMQRPRSVTVLWGGRTLADLYFDVSSIPTEHYFVPVLSRPVDGWTGARGYVQEVLLQMKLDLGNSVVYACGSDAMIHSARVLLVRSGLSPKSFYSDAFVCSATN